MPTFCTIPSLCSSLSTRSPPSFPPLCPIIFKNFPSLLWTSLASSIFSGLGFFLFSIWKKLDIRSLCVVPATSVQVPLVFPEIYWVCQRPRQAHSSSLTEMQQVTLGQGSKWLHQPLPVPQGERGSDTSLVARDGFPPLLDIPNKKAETGDYFQFYFGIKYFFLYYCCSPSLGYTSVFTIEIREV